MEVFVGADLGGTNFRVGLRQPGSLELLELTSVPADGNWGPEQLLAQLAAMLDQLGTAKWEVRGIGLGSTGDIDFVDGACYSMKRFPRLEAVHLASAIASRFQVPAQILNDGLCAALAELHAGAGRGARDFVMVTLGTGIGGGIVMDGRLLTGARGRVGKAGHQIIDMDGPVHCHCGLPGCWQTLAGKEGVIARAQRIAAEHPGSALATGELDLARVAELAAGGDTAASLVIEETGRCVGIGIANLVKILAPERVLVGGGIAERNSLLLEAIQRTADAYAIKPYQKVPVLPAELGARAGVLGASLLPDPQYWPG